MSWRFLLLQIRIMSTRPSTSPLDKNKAINKTYRSGVVQHKILGYNTGTVSRQMLLDDFV